MKEKSKITKEKIIGMIVGLIGGALLGGTVAFWGVLYIMRAYPEIKENKAFAIIFYGVYLLLLAGGVLLHTLIHEAGHGLAGRISGYSFVSFRIGNIAWVKINGRIRLKKQHVPGTMGQCLMDPPEPVNGMYPFVLYNLGGSLLNFIACAVALPLFIGSYHRYPVLTLVMGFLIGAGVALGLLNIIPLYLSGVPNDGHNARSLGKSPNARHTFWLTLRVNALTVQGQRHRDMPIEWFEMPGEANAMNDPVSAAVGILRYNYFFDCNAYEEARAQAAYMTTHVNKMPALYRNELNCELMFYELAFECREEEIEKLYTKELKRYVTATSAYMSRQRLLYAYAKRVTHNEADVRKAQVLFEKTAARWPNAGEINGEREALAWFDTRVAPVSRL